MCDPGMCPNPFRAQNECATVHEDLAVNKSRRNKYYEAKYNTECIVYRRSSKSST